MDNFVADPRNKVPGELNPQAAVRLPDDDIHHSAAALFGEPLHGEALFAWDVLHKGAAVSFDNLGFDTRVEYKGLLLQRGRGGRVCRHLGSVDFGLNKIKKSI